MITIEHPNVKAWLEVAQGKAKAWKLTMTEGKFYIRVVKSDIKTGETHPLPYAFIDLVSGSVYLAANWRFPSKKFSRGSIFDVDFGASKLGPDSPIHMHNGKPLGFKHIRKDFEALRLGLA